MNSLFSRRKFLQIGSAICGSAIFNIGNRSLAAGEDPDILGQGDYRYQVVPGWGVLDSNTPVNDCHAMIQDKSGRLLLFTNEVRNNIIIYDKTGKLLGTWGHDFPGAHGMTLNNENGEEFLYLTDHNRHQVYKTTLQGQVVFTLNAPFDTKKYLHGDEYKPTHVVIRPDGDFFVLDGYGKCFITHYSQNGDIKNIFGGRGKNPENVNEVHGGAIDHRGPEPLLIVTSRADSSLKRFSLDGKFVDGTLLTNGYPCFTIFHRDVIFVPQLYTPDKKKKGFFSVLDKTSKVISNVGGAPAEYGPDGKLLPLRQTSPIFQHPHGLLVDDEECIYIPQWASGQTYPLKFKKVA